MTTIQIHIERLILDGLVLDPPQARRVQAAIERQLAHLLTTGAAAPALEKGGAVPMLSGGTVGWKAATGPAALGEHVGRAVYRSFGT
jgi:hypothetical protein